MKKLTYSAAACALALVMLSTAPAHAGPVGPAEECGGSGQVSAFRVSGHTETDAGPVTLDVGQTTRFELDFRPARSHAATELHVRTEGTFGRFAYTRGAVGAVTAGELYTVAYEMAPPPLLAGQNVDVSIHVTGDNNTLEACVQLDVRIVG
ncbi:hypothetical protein QFZ82_000932 [Streptomyces sp. V4I23]|uniref:hypothetical protein n=1 Tax=Streptomyces sp. V4I23 TaxID=3042282 RepID=UPI00277D1A31|nr:hypothetical protein [Streptomyces sp. V4I23]MDQ1006447.1 hypothetical protein [Streptomyces sp. V4I23]